MMTNPLTRCFVTGSVIALALIAILWMYLALALPTHAAGVVGNGTPDSCTENAFVDALSGGGLVTFNCGTNPKTISITLGSQYIIQDTSMDGNGLITLDANQHSSIFHVNAGRTLALTGISLSHGHPSSGGDGGCIYVDHGRLLLVDATVSNCTVNLYRQGGGIYADGGEVTIIHSTLSGNSATLGGGVYITGTLATLNIAQSTLIGNRVDNYGGGILNLSTMTLTNVMLIGNSAYAGGGIADFGRASVNTSTLSGNTATYIGGGVLSNGILMLNTSTLSGNSAYAGGGIHAYQGVVTVNNSTLSGNSASQDGGAMSMLSSSLKVTNSTLSGNSSSVNGGGVAAIHSTVILNNSTLSGNGAFTGGGVYVDSTSAISPTNTIIANSPTGGDCSGIISVSKSSIASDNTCALAGIGDQNSVDPLLTTLNYYGGPTWVHMPKPGSPAIDGIVGNDAPATDQRGIPRPQPTGGLYDIGAVERRSTEIDLLPQLYLPLIVR